MATTAAERRVGAALLGAAAAAVLAAAFVGSCAPPAPAGAPTPMGAPASGEPILQVGLIVGAPAVTLGGDAALLVTGPDGTRLTQVPAGDTWRASATTDGISLATGSGVATGNVPQAVVTPAEPGAPVRVNGRAYRGALTLFRDRTGLTVVNQVPIEAYLLGVVSAEMGRRAASEREALRAQAVVSRTYALRNVGRWRAQGFDLYATVADQVYAGIGAETPEGREAVESTRGLFVAWNGAPIDAFFFSTCGGRTAEGTEIFRGAARPYLRSVSDVGPDGIAYCSISPRFHWREEWSGDALRAVLRRTLPAAVGAPPPRLDELQDVRVESRSASGRVAELGIVLPGEELRVDGPLVRQVLHTAAGEPLRSNAFALTPTLAGGRLTHLVAEGGGNGHGVGFCQWGAVGRARAGQTFDRILAAYYPDTELSRLY
ncbi:MAG TPA: SpoIID/LytB domain-containing protein [Gemmatimonadales bacterium]|nr:SpoIID/LytB domain-containing protein [Gemmatimonadales bacterium]